jgi:hypothetical protein
MSSRFRIPLIMIFAIIIFLVLAWFFLSWQTSQDISMVSVSTDKQEYHAGDTVHITIQNLGVHSIDIYCPAWCALGNFPTSVEQFSNGQWGYYAGFCPSIEPLFGSGLIKGEYIRHTLSAKGIFELELANLEALQLQQDRVLRIVYYLNAGNVPIYSNEFTIKKQ